MTNIMTDQPRHLILLTFVLLTFVQCVCHSHCGVSSCVRLCTGMCVESRPVTKAGSSREDNSTTSSSRSTGSVVTGFEFTGSSSMMLAAAATGLGEEEEKPSTVPSDSDVKAILSSAHYTTTPAPVRRKKEGGDTSGMYVCMHTHMFVHLYISTVEPLYCGHHWVKKLCPH